MEKELLIITIITLIINLVATAFAIFQTWLAKKSLKAAKESIESSKTQRQLEILPKSGWVIQIQVHLERWQKDLADKQKALRLARENQDKDLMKKIASSGITDPKRLSLDRFMYDEMPAWLGEIWLSAAQYYYNTMPALHYIYEEGKEPKYDFILGMENRCKESEEAIKSLLRYIKDMIPDVILETPASISNREFFRDQ